MILAGDIGGTKTSLALFERGSMQPQALETFASGEHAGLDAMLAAYLDEHRADVEAAAFGVAGPVQDGCADPTNLAWPVEADALAGRFDLPSVGLLNDLEASAWGIGGLGADDLAVLQDGVPAEGNAAVIAAGTGLGEAGLWWDGERHHPFATEGGHVDFAPRTELEVELWRFLAAELGHVSYERVCSGAGIANIHRFLLARAGEAEPSWLGGRDDRAAAISDAAAEGDRLAGQALDVFVSIYGAAAGNLALKLMATAGVYVAGGIAPKLLPRLREGAFMAAFVGKGRFRDRLEEFPVRVILNEQTPLLGAARYAAWAG